MNTKRDSQKICKGKSAHRALTKRPTVKVVAEKQKSVNNQ